ncbi:unnamed protein product [Calicophoron daubneyi]|uniref:Uncharacterized protein n=1 Tax=Calicophoron daubneyi TaxID=300641 RepID=A0AAV2T5V8_CALDB
MYLLPRSACFRPVAYKPFFSKFDRDVFDLLDMSLVCRHPGSENWKPSNLCANNHHGQQPFTPHLWLICQMQQFSYLTIRDYKPAVFVRRRQTCGPSLPFCHAAFFFLLG